MGDDIIDDGDLVVSVTGQQAGGETGTVLLENVNFTAERENTGVAGIGNKEDQAMKYGNRKYTVSTENHLNEAAAQIIINLWRDHEQPNSSFIRAEGVIECRIGKLDWNSVEWDSNDDGDVMISIEANAREVDFDE